MTLVANMYSYMYNPI